MSTDQIVLIVSLLVAVLGGVAWIIKRVDVADSRNVQLANSIKAEFREDMAAMRNEMREEMAAIKRETNEEILRIRERLHKVEPAKQTLENLLQFLKERDQRGQR